MNTDQQVADAAEAVTAAKAALDELLRIEKLLGSELPAAREALARAEKRHQTLTRPSRSASRAHELNQLKARLTEAQNA